GKKERTKRVRDALEKVGLSHRLKHRPAELSDDELTQLIGKELRFEFEQRSPTLAPARASVLTQLSWGGLLKSNSEKQEFAAALDLLLNNLELFGLNESQRAIFERFRPTETAEPSDPAELKLTTRTFVVRGVFHTEDSNTAWDLFRQHAPGGDSEICADVETVTQLYRSQTMEDGFQTLIVEVESTKYLESVEERLENIDQPTMSASRILKRINRGIDESMDVVYAIAAGILLLTAIGVSNTLFVSVLQRTPEFGIMKALGGSDRDVLWLMLLEGMICGLIGALIAVLVSLAVAAIGKSLLLDYVSGRLGSDVLSVLISFSPTLIACATLGSILVCGLASILPAWRAARLDPVEAMRR
ncbi:MAG: FtsX-like permease family protein, partial [Planctomycetaceae bacterium]